MHQTTLIADRPNANPSHVSRDPRWVRVGRGTYPFSTYGAASTAYCATIERLGLGVSEAPTCEVLNEAGNVVARVAYNGRVFAVGSDGECEYTMVLHET